MPAESEAEFQAELRRKLEGPQGGAYVMKSHGNRMQRGWPDLYVASPHWSGFLELKVDQNQASGSQQSRIKALRDRLVPAFVLRRVDGRWVTLENEKGFTYSQVDGLHASGTAILRWIAESSEGTYPFAWRGRVNGRTL